jgi:hypothetical protein
VIHLDQDRDQWQALVKTVMNLWVPEKAVNFSTNCMAIASQGGLCSMELISLMDGWLAGYNY